MRARNAPLEVFDLFAAFTVKGFPAPPVPAIHISLESGIDVTELIDVVLTKGHGAETKLCADGTRLQCAPASTLRYNGAQFTAAKTIDGLLGLTENPYTSSGFPGLPARCPRGPLVSTSVNSLISDNIH